MKRAIIILNIVCISTVSLSQDVVFSRSFDLKRGFSDNRDVFSAYDPENELLNLFLIDKDSLFINLLNMDYEVFKSMNLPIPDKKTDYLIGNFFRKDSIFIVYTNSKIDEFTLLGIDIKNEHWNISQFNFDLSGEEYVESFSYCNRFYVLTLKTLSSTLYLYELEDAEGFQKHVFDFRKKRFTEDPFKNTIYNAIFEGSDKGVQLIDASNPISLSLSTKANKIYLNNNQLYISMDNIQGHTHIISINLLNYNSSFLEVVNDKSYCLKKNKFKSNSFIYDHRLFQLVICKEQIYITVTDLKTNELLASYDASKYRELHFTNTPVVYNRPTYASVYFGAKQKDKEMKTSKKALKKLYMGRVGLSVYKNNNVYQLKVGSKLTATVTTSSGTNSFHVTGTVPGNISVSSIPNNLYNSYTTSYSTHFIGLFDAITLEHLEGDVKENVFDKISAYRKDLIYKNLKLETIINVKDYNLFGYYLWELDKYYMIKFENDKYDHL